MLNDLFITLQNILYNAFGYLTDYGELIAPNTTAFWLNGFAVVSTIALSMLPLFVVYKVVCSLVR